MGMPTLTTPRLELTPWQLGDVDALHALWIDPQVRRYLFDDVAIPRAVADEIFAANLACCQRRQAGMFALRRHDNPAIVGFAGLRWDDSASDQPELLYGLAPQSWGEGLAVEASRAVLADAWQRLRIATVWASADAPNVASFNVMERLGMQRTTPAAEAPRLIRYRWDAP